MFKVWKEDGKWFVVRRPFGRMRYIPISVDKLSQIVCVINMNSLVGVMMSYRGGCRCKCPGLPHDFIFYWTYDE